MARIVPGAIIADIRGKVGGGVFQRSAQGLTLRNFTTPIKGQSQKQMENRAQVFQLQIAWQALTEGQRKNWAAWADYQAISVGQFVVGSISGQQAFLQLNRYRLLQGQAILSTPIFTPYTLPSPTLALDRGSGPMYMHLSLGVAETTYKPFLYLSPPLPPARESRPNFVRLMVPLTFVSGSIWSIQAPYVTAFGAVPVVGKKVWYQLGLQQTDCGALSIFTTGTITVTDIL